MSATATAPKGTKATAPEKEMEAGDNTPNAGEVTHNVPNVATLADKIKNIEYERSTLLLDLRNAREFHSNQIEEIDGLLAELGNPVDMNPTPTATGKGNKGGGTGRGSGPRGGREQTMQSAVEGLLMKYKAGLGRADIVGKMMSEVKYETSSKDPKDFANTVYTGGINKLVQAGKVITVGQRPNTVYKHRSHATAAEIKAFDEKAA